ncbi:hypothetical protein QRO11_15315 [Paracidovorax citrulli]|uniref:Outer membrane efflux protein n=1 Tax=Paracidovorax citrulli TaxID=80869 RepID=A0ABY9AKZ0_PARCI|nr:hypothetical protein [Paracidovorax citrulli]ATG94686.1 hypothetical protein CQB05_12150 [Paracidovorax citrulli]QCX12177.1 hypothetical protein APS58_3419 [Paracidovorax citrulli]UMT84033.1 hypothetical protein FRC75_12010 [Paracidovorax citrulli]UMT87803.1 hypothetical protein FRC90_06765 [Paracidovorax citrulli]UMT97500.1 hypothetical protein FRC97_22385 [Paracidovorax citrulli]
MGEATGAFAEAYDAAKQIRDTVLERQGSAIERAVKAQDAARQTIEEMGKFTPALLMSGSAPDVPDLQASVTGNLELPDLGRDSFGVVTPVNRSDVVVGAIAPVQQIEVEGFNPGFAAIQIPEAPDWRDYGAAPTAPAIREVVPPEAPRLEKPLLPSLDNIVIPHFDFPTLPEFTAQSPEFQGSHVSTVLQWREVPYKVTILEEELAQLRRMWAGGTGLPPAVEKALWERAASREDIAVSRDISAAATEFSSRGFTMPPGMMVNRIDAIRSEAMLRKQTLGRDVLIKVTDAQIENVRFACTQAIAAEQVLVGIWSAVAGRAFEAAKIQLDSELALLNAQIAIFNAKQSAYATEATVFRARLDAQLARIQVYRAELDGELAKGQVNEQRVRTYQAQVQALQLDLEIYKSQMQGAQLESEQQRTRVEIFKAEVQAHAELLQADKVRFDAYESRVKGETAKASLIDAQARAYSAYVSGQAAKADISIKNQAAEISQAQLRVQAFVANLDKDKTLIQQQSAAIQANAEAHRANTARYTAKVGAESAAIGLQLQAQEANMRTSIAAYEVEIRKYVADMEQMIRVASIQLEALKSASQAASTLAAGAMAGISLGSSVSGGSGVSASANYSESMQIPTPGSTTNG